MLDVLLTVDTEVWPRSRHWREQGLSPEFARDYSGVTPTGNFGVPYQIDTLNGHGLKAVFFVEALCAHAAGNGLVRDMVAPLLAGGQEVQLHIHPEWLQWSPAGSGLPPYRGPNMADYSVEEQVELFRAAVENLRQCGVEGVRAFRAGNYGAGNTTLQALARAGLDIDSSHNAAYLGSDCSIKTRSGSFEAHPLDGVHEFPVSCFTDGFGRLRHCQLASCSLAELKELLVRAEAAGWKHLVIVSHSFELIRRLDDGQGTPVGVVDTIVKNRFDGLCRFLADHPTRFRTIGFQDVSLDDAHGNERHLPATTGLAMTVGRYVQQALRRY